LKTNELDTRGSHFYLALYWAQTLAEQDRDGDLKARFTEVAEKLGENEERIIGELNRAQGKPGDIGGYYRPDRVKATQAMRASATFNAIVDGL
jgi:isocitrate dehydrogenase